MCIFLDRPSCTSAIRFVNHQICMLMRELSLNMHYCVRFCGSSPTYQRSNDRLLHLRRASSARILLAIYISNSTKSL